MIAAGDPCQLPAVIAHPTEVKNSKHGMLRGLFSRLQTLGHVPHMLRTQYRWGHIRSGSCDIWLPGRCHPEICKVPNEFFYDGRLVNGCLADDRPSLVPDWPALCHVQATGTATRDLSSASYWNKPEVSRSLNAALTQLHSYL